MSCDVETDAMKTCTYCKVQQGLVAFSKKSANKDKLQPHCKSCAKENNKAWREANKNEVAEYIKAWQIANKDALMEYQKAHYEENKPKRLAQCKAWQQANPAKVNAISAKRRAAKDTRTPHWLTKEDFVLMEQFYIDAKKLTLSTGILHHVDHIYPLQGKNVCGFHMPSNLQILTAIENMKKSNKFQVGN